MVPLGLYSGKVSFPIGELLGKLLFPDEESFQEPVALLELGQLYEDEKGSVVLASLVATLARAKSRNKPNIPNAF